MTIITLKRHLANAWLLPMAIGACAFLFAFFSNPTSMAFWKPRMYAANCIAACLLAHVIAMLWLFLRKRWKIGFVALGALPIFVFGAFIVLMSVGPDLDIVRTKVSTAASVPISKLVCRGGCLARESTIIFEANDDATINTELATIVSDDTTLSRIKNCALEFNVPLSGDFKAWRFTLDYDNIVVVKDDVKWLLIFFGMSSM